MKKFQVSVITPVYNAARYIEHAVESALNLAEVGEIILVEDGSPDNALAICKKLEQQHSKVKVFQHSNGENRGAGASRNLGIEKASCDYIAFLDADDWYLPNRFEAEKKLFSSVEVDGVYGATGFYDENTKELNNSKITTFDEKLTPEALLFHYVSYKGRFTTDAITVRKSLFEKSGVFNTQLRLHQDTHLWYRLAYHGQLHPGIIDKPVAIRRVHDQNRIAAMNSQSRSLFHKAVFNDFIQYKNVDKKVITIVVNRFIASNSTTFSDKLIAYAKTFLKHPHLLLKYLL